jgi:hypothetical protein
MGTSFTPQYRLSKTGLGYCQGLAEASTAAPLGRLRETPWVFMGPGWAKRPQSIKTNNSKVEILFMVFLFVKLWVNRGNEGGLWFLLFLGVVRG